MGIRLLFDDIFNIEADAMVVPICPDIAVRAGLNEDVYRKAGIEEIIEEREVKNRTRVELGNSTYTRSYKIKNCKYLIHTSVPVWPDKFENDRELLNDLTEELLKSCYQSIFYYVKELALKSVVIPLLSAGIGRCPASLSYALAFETAERFLRKEKADVDIMLVTNNPIHISQITRIFSDLENSGLDISSSNLKNYVNSYVDKKYISDELNLIINDLKERISSKELDDIASNVYDIPTLAHKVEYYMKRCHINTKVELAELICISESTLYKLLREERRDNIREILWRMVFIFRLSVAEATELFATVNQALFTSFRMSHDEAERELVLLDLLSVQEFDVETIEDILEDREFKELFPIVDSIKDTKFKKK